jgi:hypothetical protein
MQSLIIETLVMTDSVRTAKIEFGSVAQLGPFEQWFSALYLRPLLHPDDEGLQSILVAASGAPIAGKTDFFQSGVGGLPCKLVDRR